MLTGEQITTNTPRNAPWKPGQSGNLNGKPKGTANKTTQLLKDAILEAASLAGGSNDRKGLVAYLMARAEDTPGPFLALLGKVLPMQLSNDDGTPISFTVVYEAKKGIDYADDTPQIEQDTALQRPE